MLISQVLGIRYMVIDMTLFPFLIIRKCFVRLANDLTEPAWWVIAHSYVCIHKEALYSYESSRLIMMFIQ
jgi:hypothetical protein